MPRQSLLVSRGPAGVKGLPTDRRAGNKWDGVRGVIWNRTPQTLRRSRRTHRWFWRAGQTSLPRSGHRGGRCIGWTAATVCPCSWLRTLHVKAAAWTRTGNTGPLREEKENVRHSECLLTATPCLSYSTLKVAATLEDNFSSQEQLSHRRSISLISTQKYCMSLIGLSIRKSGFFLKNLTAGFINNLH